MAARRCPICLTNWPAEPLKVGDRTETFLICPEDEAATQYMTNAEPIPEHEATTRVKHAAFERYLEQREAAPAGPLSEADAEQFSAQLLDWNGDAFP